MKLLQWPPWRNRTVGLRDKHNNFQCLMDLNQTQRDALQEFRKRVGHVVPPYFEPDHELVKWLIARNFNVDKAETMLLKSLEWRKQNDVDDIFSYDPPEVFKKYFGVGMTGVDKGGYPVWIVPYGSVDIKGILQSADPKDYIKYTIQILEKGPRVVREQTASKRTDDYFRQCVIFDLDQFSLRHFTWKPVIDVVVEIIQIHEANYPELLRKAYVINAPMLFQVLFSALKPFLGEETIKKIRIFGTSGWKEALLEDIPADQIPVHFGGTMTDPNGDPKCPSLICYGGEVPKSYYLKNRKTNEAEMKSKEFKTLILPSSGKETFEFKVPEPGYHIRWEFATDDFDIGFGVTRICDGLEEILIPLRRVNSQLVPEEGTIICSEIGTYKVTFDNEFSYVRSKNLRYNLKLIPPSAFEQTKL